jgi:hypothetical protein
MVDPHTQSDQNTHMKGMKMRSKLFATTNGDGNDDVTCDESSGEVEIVLKEGMFGNQASTGRRFLTHLSFQVCLLFYRGEHQSLLPT